MIPRRRPQPPGVRPRHPGVHPRRMPLSLAVLLIIALSGCQTAAPRGDYAAYRRVRVSPTLHQQLAAVHAYLSQYPGGHFVDDASSLLATHESAYYRQLQSTIPGLNRYLLLYPQGRFARQARERIRALKAIRRAENQVRDAQGNRREQPLEAGLNAHLSWPSKAAAYWLRTLLGVRNWGVPIAEVAAQNGAFNHAFDTAPRPQCSRRECLKRYQSPYIVPNPGGLRVDGELELILRLRLADGHLLRAEVLMPNRGFSRWYEHETRALAHDDNPEARQAAIAWALDRLLPWVSELSPNAIPVDVIPEPIDKPTLGGRGGVGVAPTEQASITLPMTLQSFQIDNAQLVFFAAAEDDDGEAYDGFFIQAATPSDPQLLDDR